MRGLLRRGAAVALTTLVLGQGALARPARTLTVRFAADVAAERVHEALSVAGVVAVAQPRPDTYVVEGRRRQTAEQLATLFAAIPGVAGTDPVPPYDPADSYQPAYVQDVPLGGSESLAAGRLMGSLPLGGRDVAVHFHPGTAEAAQQRFQRVFAAATVRRTGRYALIVRPAGPTAAAVRAYRLVPIVRQAEPHHGS